MKRLLFFCLWICAVCLRAAVPTFESFSTEQFQTNSLRVFYRDPHTNDNRIIYPALANSLTLVTNENVYGTFSLPSKVQLLTLGTNYLDMSTNTTWLLNSPTNDATQVIISLSAGAYQGQLALITSQNGANAFTLPNQSEQWDVPGAVVWLSGSDWIGTTNRGILMQYTAPDWVAIERFDPSGGGGGSALWYMLNGALTPSPAVNVVSNTVFAATTTFWTTNLGNATNPSVAIDGTLANPGAGIYRAANGALAIASTAVNVATFNTDSVRFGDAMPLLWSSGSPDTVAVRFGFYHGSGSPEGVQTANVGSSYTDWANGTFYGKTNGVGNTGWGVLNAGAAGSGTTINPTDTYMPYRIDASNFGDSPLARTTEYSVSLISTNLAVNPNFIVQSNGTNALSAIYSGYLSDSSGAVEASQINITKAGANWGAGTPTLRDGSFNVSVLHDAAMNQRLGIDGDTGLVSFFDRTGLNIIATINNTSGYTGAGTLFLSDDGTYKPAGSGSALWASAGGVLEPSPAIDLVRIESQLADNATNVALVVKTAAPWTDATLVNFNDKLFVTADGALYGINATTNWGIYDTALFISVRDETLGDPANTEVFWLQHNPGVGDSGVQFTTSTNHVVWDVYTTRTPIEEWDWVTDIDTSQLSAFFKLRIGGRAPVDFTPTALATVTPFVLDSYNTHTSGNLFELGNNQTNKFTVNFAGATTVGSVTKAQKTAMTPADGMLVYQTDNTPGFRGYVNGTWFILSTAADP